LSLLFIPALQGKKKRLFDNKGREKWYRLSDWKKAYVTFAAPADYQEAWEQQRQRQRQE
jgi:hypothetical protein